MRMLPAGDDPLSDVGQGDFTFDAKVRTAFRGSTRWPTEP
ncbi:hypothetical protein M2280_005023 [Prescottella agglutinans]|uniref:Uncharacterized protein n=1 Tax=Prescottella agglutinans TaxID=1644129 RepID=A0ABT6MHI7_9NOCA|nr:hypothetical protein [Prescottella agglutinans]